MNGFSRLHTRGDSYNERVLNLQTINLQQILTLIFKIKNNHIKNNFSLQYRHEIHNYSTRRRSYFQIPYFRTNSGSSTTLYRGLQLYNSLPSNLKIIININEFKRKLKEYLTNANS